MTPFLKLVADTYLQHHPEDISEMCFVFPNKRSALFFNHYLGEAVQGANGGDTFIYPETQTIDDFVGTFSRELVDATRYEQLFTLFAEYQALSHEAMEFDRFRFWGDMLLTDFAEIDRYMVDARGLFVNIKRLREINSTYLTDEQREVIKKYWGEERPEQPIDRFWTHIRHGADSEGEESSSSEQFLKLWAILEPLYDNFHSRLAESSLTTPGRRYRLAVERLKQHGVDASGAKRYVFVGFNMLSTAELKMFEMLKARGQAEFYWDTNCPAVEVKEGRMARMIAGNAEMFPSRYPLDEEKITIYGQIDIVAVPSRQAQAKVAMAAIEQLVEEGRIKDTSNAINTAVVLPDESMLIPVADSMTKAVESVNITMSYPMKLTPLAALIRTIVSMHLRARKVKDEFCYFHEDVKTLAANPLLRTALPILSADFAKVVAVNRLYMLPVSLLKSLVPEFGPIFEPVVNTQDFKEVGRYMENVLDFLRRALTAPHLKRQRMVLNAYADALAELREAIQRFGVVMQETTVFQLLESAINASHINYKGEPLKGLQVMGMLETRSLDFDNVIVLSMNERIFPRRHVGSSFIPEALRRGYGLPTADMREASTAYNFFRLLSRASSVTLLYDARAESGRSNERSRYLTQLLYLYNRHGGVVHKAANYPGTSFPEEPVELVKSPRVMKKLMRYTLPGSKKFLSPSAINNYINCPLGFYLRYVEGMDVDEEVTDFMDASTYGTIMHEVARKLYTSLRDEKPTPESPITVSKADIQGYLDSPIRIERMITALINEHYNHLPAGDLSALGGDAYALEKVMLTFIRKMLEEDLKKAPFTFEGAEMTQIVSLKVAPGLTVNYKQTIDRIDRVGGRLRIVDYKTGVDKTDFRSVDDLFRPGDERRKAILQLMLYCHIYSLSAKTNQYEAIQPIIYSFQNMMKDGVTPLKYIKEDFTDYRVLEDEFMERLRSVIAELFNPDIPFTQAVYPEACTYCQFKELCGKEG